MFSSDRRRVAASRQWVSMGGLLKERESCGCERRRNDFDVADLVPLDFAPATCHSSG